MSVEIGARPRSHRNIVLMIVVAALVALGILVTYMAMTPSTAKWPGGEIITNVAAQMPDKDRYVYERTFGHKPDAVDDALIRDDSTDGELLPGEYLHIPTDVRATDVAYTLDVQSVKTDKSNKIVTIDAWYVSRGISTVLTDASQRLTPKLQTAEGGEYKPLTTESQSAKPMAIPLSSHGAVRIRYTFEVPSGSIDSIAVYDADDNYAASFMAAGLS